MTTVPLTMSALTLSATLRRSAANVESGQRSGSPIRPSVSESTKKNNSKAHTGSRRSVHTIKKLVGFK